MYHWQAQFWQIHPAQYTDWKESIYYWRFAWYDLLLLLIL